MAEADIYKAQGFGSALGIGQAPALLLVDFTVGFNDARLFGGGNIAAAVHCSVGLLEFFRRNSWPIAHSRIVYAADGSDIGVFARKIPGLAMLADDSPAGQIVPELFPRAGELVVKKTQASAFFGTGLVPWLAQRRIDTLVVAGCTTSGCVRASVVDAASWNFSPVVVSDCVGDRALGPHEANLFDMKQKYADVMPKAELIGVLSENRSLA